jgi:large subunit ribosomal protein L37Ae
MTRTKKVGSTGRLGARYGAKLRRRVLDIEKKRNEPHRCPSCATKGSLQRAAAGLWRCRKCNLLFAGGAYVPATDAGKAAKRAIDQRTSDELLALREDTEETPEFMTPIKEILEAQDAEIDAELDAEESADFEDIEDTD